jgi:uncharacterized protein YlaN (UPF0358 family)
MMKLYSFQTPPLVRVNIKEPGKKVRHLAFKQCDIYECMNGLTECLNREMFGLEKETKVSIQCREWYNGKNGKSVTYSLNAPSADKVYELLHNFFFMTSLA